MWRRLIASLLMLSVTVLGTATTSRATGFRITAHGAKAMGMGGAFAAQADDPSAIYYNPAGITQLDGTQVQVGALVIHNPGSSFTPFPGQATLPLGTFAQNADIPNRTFFLPTLFVTHSFTDRFAAGFGTYTPFGLQLDWPDTWAGRQITTFNELKSNYFDFAAAYDVLPWWTVSAGVDFVYSKIKLSRTALNTGFPTFDESLVQFDADGTGFTYEVATLLRLARWAKVGASYRHQAVIDYDGDLRVSPVAGGFALAGVQPSQSASTTIALPRTFTTGIAVKPIDRWTVEFDWDFTFWQSFKDLSLRVPDSPAIQNNFAAAAGPFPNRRWKNSHIFRLGTQYQLLDTLALRVGTMYITTPIPDETLDPILPDSDRTSGTVGFGYTFLKNFTFDFAYEYQHFHDRAKNNNIPITAAVPGLRANGVYKTDAHVFVAQLKYKF